MKNLHLISIKKTTVSLVTVLLLVGCLAFNLGDNYRRIKYGVARGIRLEGVLLERKLEHELTDHVISMAPAYFIRPRNAYLDSATDQVLPEIYGQKIDITATVKTVMHSKPHTELSLVLIPLEPEITADIYQNIRTKKAGFLTGFGGGNRGHNICMAASSLNNYLLAPGEIFSFNRATMPRDAEHGYKLAPIIVGDTIVPGYGGGICQVSTTLYNAVKRAKLEVVERFPHSMPVDYVPPGMDATVSDYLDFKFRNNQDRYILLKTATHGYCLVVEIWE